MTPGLRVLLLLGEPAHLDVLARRMGRRGVQAVGAACVAEALRILRRDEFHCAVLDLALPVVDGLEPFTVLRAVAPEMPLVLLSNRALPGAGGGACRCLAKPCGLEEIMEAVGEAVASQPGRPGPRGRAPGPDTRAGPGAAPAPRRPSETEQTHFHDLIPEDERV